VFTLGDKEKPVVIAKKAVEHAQAYANDIVLIDTAGRLHINAELMDELKAVKQTVRPHEILLVVDAMTGQDAVTVAESFNNDLGLDGVILTKLDGDARGGAALSVKAVTGCPIKFAGMGEKLEALEPFHPDRMASRILGMGDVLSLIEKAEQAIDFDKAQALEKKLRKEEFTLDDFLDQLQQVRKLGSIEQILGMIPGMGGLAKKLQGAEFDEKQLKHVEAIIRSMTKKERRDPNIINGSRRKRIAAGSGTRVQDVNRLLKQFADARKMMKQFQQHQKSGKKGGFKLPFMR
jgi:signal recognition particle subunit SRP54